MAAPPQKRIHQRKVIPFPAAPRNASPDLFVDGQAPEVVPPKIEEAWSEELEQLAGEPDRSPLCLVMAAEPGRTLLDFLETTGLRALVRIKEAGGDFFIFSGKPTVSRLVVWQALDLRLSFTVKTETWPSGHGQA